MIQLEKVVTLLLWLLSLIDSEPGLKDKLLKKLKFYSQSLKSLLNVLKKDSSELLYIQNLKDGINRLSQGHNMLILEIRACSLRLKTDSEQKLFLKIKNVRFPVYSVENGFFIPDNLFIESKTQIVANEDIDSEELNLAGFMGLYPKYRVNNHSEYFQWLDSKINESSLETKICADRKDSDCLQETKHHYGFLKANVYTDGIIVNKALFTLKLDVDEKNTISSSSPELYEYLTFSEISYLEEKIRKIIKKLMITSGLWKKCFRKNCYFHKKPFLQENSDSKIRCPHMHTQCENCGKEEHLDSCEEFGKFNKFIENIFDIGFYEAEQDKRDFYPWLF